MGFTTEIALQTIIAPILQYTINGSHATSDYKVIWDHRSLGQYKIAQAVT